MAAQQYYHGDQNFPPPPNAVPNDGLPPPYSLHPPQQGPPQPSQPSRPHLRLQPTSVPWQKVYNSYHHPSQHYYAPHSPLTYPQGQIQGQQNAPYPRRSPSPYTHHPRVSRPSRNPQSHSPARPHRSSSEHTRQHHHHHHRKRSSSRDEREHEKRDGLLGAAGGGLIGDLLLGPGVGTLGGAIIGALKGRQHGRRKDERD